MPDGRQSKEKRRKTVEKYQDFVGVPRTDVESQAIIPSIKGQDSKRLPGNLRSTRVDTPLELHKNGH